MLNQIIDFSLRRRGLILLSALAVLVLGTMQIFDLPIDVFPDLNRPTVVIMTEAPGLAPEEVEALVTRPIESLVNGATGVTRVRSSSAVGLSIIWVEFDWGTDIYRDRQVVNEKLTIAENRLPPNISPIMGPISSLMGEIFLVGFRPRQPSDDPDERARLAMQMRTLAEFNLRNRLLAIEGVSQITAMGGILQQYQILTSPERLAANDVSLDLLVAAAEKANVIAGGGILERSTRELLIRISAPALELEQIENTPVVWRDSRPLLIKHVADVRFGGPVKRGDGSVLIREGDRIVGGDAVILSIQKQPQANTLDLDRRVREALDEFEAELPPTIAIDRDVFRQANFIENAMFNVIEAVRDGAIWVVVVLFLILWNLRTSAVTLTAIPLSVMITFLVFRWLGITINTMTLGGIAVAIGELVDDSVVDIENIYRRLRENRQLQQPRSTLRVVFEASSEIRNSIVYATLIVVLVVLPLFAMAGLEGRLFAPLGLAYLVTLLASLLVSLTVTPVLASFLLGNAKIVERRRDPLLLRILKAIDRRVIEFAVRRASLVLWGTVVLATASLFCVSMMGGEFLPEFNEGTLTINVVNEPGTSLTETTRIAKKMEQLLFAVPEVQSVARRTGRAEQDEHAEGINSSDLEVTLIDHHVPKPGWLASFIRFVPFLHRYGYDEVGRPREQVLDHIREQVTSIPTIGVNIGQPISHRLDHIVSGVRAEIVVKIFGPDLLTLRSLAFEAQSLMAGIPGVVDLQMESQIEVPQLRVTVRHAEAARYGFAAGEVARLLETAFRGQTVSQVLVDDQFFDLVVWYDESSRNNPTEIAKTILDSPSGRKVALGQIADVVQTTGPNVLNHENAQRRIAVYCNVEGRDLSSVVTDIRVRLNELNQSLSQLAGGYRLELGGQYEAKQQANRNLAIFGFIAVVGIFFLLCQCLRSWRAALQVLVNIPLAAIGSVTALLIFNPPDWQALAALPFWQWPITWIRETHLSVAHWVGFITLIGIVSRNGIMMISHYIHLMEFEGEQFDRKMIVRGSLERLAPVLMTALTTMMGLVPLLLGAGEPGKEILHPLAIVVFGGLAASTLLDQVVTPALFYKFGRKVFQPAASPNESSPE